MTREQALEIIKRESDLYSEDSVDSVEWLEVYKALEQQPSEDCVSREQAIKTIGTDIQLNLEGRSGLLKYSDEIKDILKALLDSQEKKLKALPPVTPTQRWIPISERLPKTDGVYIVTRRLFDNQIDIEPYYIVDACYFDGTNTWHNDNRINHNRHYVDDIIAWMPLPQPYEEKRGNSDGSN